MRSAKLGDVVVSMKNGIYKPASEYGDDGFPCLRMYNIDAGQIVWRDIKRMRLDERELTEYGLTEGDLLVNRVNSRELVGKSAYIPASLPPSVFESKNIRVRLDRSKALPKFINYQLLACGSRHFANNAQQVVGMASISQGQLAEFPVRLTTLDEQRRIVAEIEEQFSRLDQAVLNLERVKANLKRQRASILRDAVAGRLVDGLNPTSWQVVLIGEVAQVISGLTKNPKRAALPRKLPYLRVANVYANELRLDDIEYIGVADDEVEKLLVRRGDLLLVEGNGSPDQIGRVALWDGAIHDCVHQNHLIKVRFGDDVSPRWAMTWLLSPAGRNEIEQMSSSTSGLHTLSTGKIRRLPIPTPPPLDQVRIVAEVDRCLSIVREVEAEVEANLKRAQALRQAILQHAFSGGFLRQPAVPVSRPVPTLLPGARTEQESIRVLLSAEIVHRLHAEPEFGRIKHQKLLHLCEHVARIEAIQSQYRRAAAGPLDMPLLEANEAALERFGWYAGRQRDTGTGHCYRPLSHAGEHAPYLTCFGAEQLKTVRELIEMMRGWKTDRCEILSTTYAAWNDLLLLGKPADDEAIVREVRQHWHDRKRRFSEERWRNEIAWIRAHGLMPIGFGRPTRGETEAMVPQDLFSAAGEA